MRWWLLLLVGCSAPASQPALGDALARVEGQPIQRAEVEALVAATGLAPRDALRALVSERLLVAHARAYASSAEVERGVEQALVQRLLALEVGEGDVDTQRARLDSLLVRLRAETRVQYREETIGRVFAP
jgi:hypothetical protein